jgi:hypothetical protein
MDGETKIERPGAKLPGLEDYRAELSHVVSAQLARS